MPYEAHCVVRRPTYVELHHVKVTGRSHILRCRALSYEEVYRVQVIAKRLRVFNVLVYSYVYLERVTVERTVKAYLPEVFPLGLVEVHEKVIHRDGVQLYGGNHVIAT